MSTIENEREESWKSHHKKMFERRPNIIIIMAIIGIYGLHSSLLSGGLNLDGILWLIMLCYVAPFFMTLKGARPEGCTKDDEHEVRYSEMKSYNESVNPHNPSSTTYTSSYIRSHLQDK